MSAAPGRPRQARAAGRGTSVHARPSRTPGQRIAAAAALCVALGCGLSAAGAEEGETVEGYGRIEGRYCAAMARLVLDDGRRFEFDTRLAPGTAVEVRGATTGATVCGRAARLTGTVVAVPARPAIELTLHARDWPRHAGDVDGLSRRFPAARLRLRVLAAGTDEAHTAVLHIGTLLLRERPELMARSTITPVPAGAARDAARGWRVAFDAADQTRSIHADSADDVARLLAAGR